MSVLLEIENLSVEYFRGKKIIPAVRNVSIILDAGESAGIVGESGSGKSTVALSILKLLSSHDSRISGGKINFMGQDILQIAGEDIRKIRGKDIGIIFQDPFSSLNPVLRIGEQIEETIEIHADKKMPHLELRTKTIGILESVRMKDPQRIYDAFPHQVSGGQRQRAMIAMAIANRPKLLIADEPTTALDVTVQKEILDLLTLLRNEMNMALILITHHLGIVSQTTERLYVMYQGEIVEEGLTKNVLKNPQHPYTQNLLQSIPRPHD